MLPPLSALRPGSASDDPAPAPADDPVPQRGAKPATAHPLNGSDTRRRAAPEAEKYAQRRTSSPPDRPGEQRREVALKGEAQASTQGRAGQAGAGISGRLQAGVKGQAGLDTDDLLPVLHAGGEASTGAGFEQYAQAGLAPLRLGERELVREPLAVAQKTHGFAGAKAGAQVSAGPTHVDGNVEAFAGAKTGGQAALTLGNQRLHASGDVRAGIGVEAKAKAGLKRTPEGRTRLQLEGRLGAALGVGGAVGGGVDLDVTPIADGIDALPRPARKGLKSLGASVGRAGKAVAKAGKAAAEFVGAVVSAPVRFVKALFS